MDEGDDYMPQCNQMVGQFGMGDMPGPPGGGQPPYGGGLTPMNNPYDPQQQMMMLGGQSQPPKQTKQPPSKSRSSKAKKESMDPMQSMAAMSNNPMMRSSMHNTIYPPQQQGHGQMGQYAGQQPMQGYPPGYGQNPRGVPPPNAYPGGPYPPQHGQYPNGGYPGYPPGAGGAGPYHQGYPPAAQQYPGMGQPYPPTGQQMPNTSMPNGGGYWPQQGHDQFQNRQPSREQWLAAQEHRMVVLREHMEQVRYQLYMIDSGQAPPNNRDYLRNQMMQMQTEMSRIHGTVTAAQQGYQPQSGHSVDPMTSQMGMTPSSNPQQTPQATVSIQHQNSMTTNSNPVSVTQSGAQVQVNIKPPDVGHTTINVIHQFGEPNSSESSQQAVDSKDSIPPEPIPSQAYASQMERSQSSVSNPYSTYPTPTSQQSAQPAAPTTPQHTNGIGNGYHQPAGGMFNGYATAPQEQVPVKNETEDPADVKPPEDKIDPDIPPPAPLPGPSVNFGERDDATPPMVAEEPVEDTPAAEPEEDEEVKPSTSEEADSTVEEQTEQADTTMDDEETKQSPSNSDKQEEEEDEEETVVESTTADEEMPQESVQYSESQLDNTPEPSSVAQSAVSEPTTSDEQPIPDSVKTDLAPEPSEIADSADGIFTEPSTPAQAPKKAPRRPVVQRQRKRKNYEDSGDDDDEFFVTKKQKKTAKKTFDIPEERPPSKWAEAVGDEDFEDTILTTDSQDTVSSDLMVVEKILNSKEGENGADEQFLIKWKNKAYKHCEWKTLKELEELDKRVAAKVKRFKQKNVGNDDDEDFNPDYTIVDRVVDITVGEEGIEYALVKWKSLGYDEVTYEPLAEVEQEWPDKVELWRRRQIVDKCKLKEKARPDETEFKYMNPNKVWKNQNKLRDYQFEGVDWLCFCWYKGQNCILADEMGLGKTVQSITFLNHCYEYGIHGPFLVVVPLSTIQHWVREFEAWTDMNAVVYHGSAHAREILQQYEVFYSKEHSGKQWKKNLVKLDVLITTFEVVVTDAEFLKKIPWKNCVIDEAHRLKNRNCKLLQSGLSLFRLDHRVLLTGTPLQNNIDELFSLLNFLHPEQFHSSAEFLASYGSCESDTQVTALQEILKPMMLRRLKEDVEKSLQPKQETIIEVQLSDVQKKYYRAILERNFSHLCKGTSAPSLMNVMMELRKCCNHPFLIQGAEAMVIQDTKIMHPEYDDDQLWHQAALQSSGKLILIDKLLPKLRKDGHKVLIFSQMVKLLNILEDYLQYNNYPYERIDGNVRGDIRQASIDRFSRPDSDRFVFLLCTKAGGLGINLTAADTVIIFDSDWNPQNDLQAQARCHRIGQTKMVKVYRLITSNTYEREMFDRASLKLGLDKAVLQSTTALKDSSTALNKKEIEDLLKKGAYGSIMDENNDGSKFSEEDIETILQRRATTITLEPGQKGSLFSKATFNSQQNKGDDIDIDDPEFWNKWAEKAEVDVQKALQTADGKELILQEPRKRTKRFEENSLKEGEESDGSSEGGKRKRGQQQNRKRKRGDDEDQDYYRPDELSFNKSEYFRVQKVLGSWGWGRWSEMRKYGELDLSENDIIHMARTMLIHCCREFRGDERVKRTVWALITPREAKQAKGASMDAWSLAPEYNPPNFAIDNSFQRHVHRNANKIMVRVDQLYHLKKEIIGAKTDDIEAEKKFDEIAIKVPVLPDTLCEGWDADCDKSLYIGAYKHGIDAVEQIRADPTLAFVSKSIDPFPAANDISMRFRRLVAMSQKEYLDPVYSKKPKFSKKDEQEFLRVFKSYGITELEGDKRPYTMNWSKFRTLSPNLTEKPIEEMEEYFMCLLAYITKVTGGDLVGIDLKRALSVTEHLTHRRAQKILQRITGLRKLHKICEHMEDNEDKFALISMDNMPTGWTVEMDKQLLEVVHENGLENLANNLLQKADFQKIIRPPDKTLLKRVFDIVTCFETGQWAGNFSVASIEDSEDEGGTPNRSTPVSSRARGGTSSSSRKGRLDDSKMRAALLQQSMLSMNNEVAMAQLQLLLPLLLQQAGTAGGSQGQAALQMLQALLTPQASTSSSSSASAAAQQQQQLALLMMLLQSGQLDPEVLGLPGSTKKSSSAREKAAAEKAAAEKAAAEKAEREKAEKEAMAQQQQFAALAALMAAAGAQQSGQQNDMQKMILMMQLEAMSKSIGLSPTDIVALGSLHPDVKVPLRHKKTDKLVEQKVKNIVQYIKDNPDYKIDLTANVPKQPSTPAPALTPVVPTADTSAPPSAKASAPSSPKAVKDETSSSATPAPESPSETAIKLEPGEVKKSSAGPSVEIKASGQLLQAFNITTGELLPVTKWPTSATVYEFLKTNPDCGIHSSSVTPEVKTAAGCYANRLGNEPAEGTSSSTPTPATPSATPSTAAKASTSSSSAAAQQKELEQVQQMLIQQATLQQLMMQQAMLGMSPYGSVLPGSSSSSKQSEEVNPLVMSAIMSNPQLMMQMMMSDPMMMAALGAQASSSSSSSSKKLDKK